MARTSPLISRLLTLAFAMASVVAMFWIGSQVAAPVFVPAAPLAKARVVFDARADVSQQPVFQRLEPMGPEAVQSPNLGRVNPFAPVLPPVIETTTSTSTSSTQP